MYTPPLSRAGTLSDLCLLRFHLPGSRKSSFKIYILCALRSSSFSYRLQLFSSIPFFFEPNFDAVVAPLAAAHRIQDELPGEHHLNKRQLKKTYVPTQYGEFLLRKIGGNFANGGKGKYDS